MSDDLSTEQQGIYRLLVEQGQGLQCAHDREGRLLMVNRAAAESLGFRPEELVGTELFRLLDVGMRPQFDAYLERVWTIGRDEGLMRLRTRSGHPRVWSYSNIKYEQPSYGPIVLGHAMDVTEHTWEQRSMRRRDDRYQAFIRRTSEGIGRIDFDRAVSTLLEPEELIERTLRYGYLAECNDALARLYGAPSAQEMTGVPLRNLPTFSEPRHLDQMLKFIRDGFHATDFAWQFVDVEGNRKNVATNLLGVVEDDMLQCFWVLQREIRDRLREELAAAARDRHLTDD